MILFHLILSYFKIRIIISLIPYFCVHYFIKKEKHSQMERFSFFLIIFYSASVCALSAAGAGSALSAAGVGSV